MTSPQPDPESKSAQPGKRPAFQFYPSDWMNDPALRACGIAARGLWIDAMCIAHHCDPYGYLILNSRPMNAAQLATRAGISGELCEELLGELAGAGVFSRDEKGAIFSRRMVRDEHKRNVRAEGGKHGAEFGVLGKEHGKKGGRPRRDGGVRPLPLEPFSDHTQGSTTPDGTAVPGIPSRFDRFWAAYPKKEARKNAERTFQKLSPDDSTLDRMIAAIKRECGSAAWAKEDGRFIPHPAKWLNDRRWEDEPTSALKPVMGPRRFASARDVIAKFV